MSIEKKESDEESVYAIMEQRDEQQILSELAGQYIEGFVYSF